MQQKSGVYKRSDLIHFSPAYKHAKHYVGYADDIGKRVAEQRAGTGARLCQVAVAAGCHLVLARVWPGQTRRFERQIKNHKNAPRHCPICAAERQANRK